MKHIGVSATAVSCTRGLFLILCSVVFMSKFTESMAENDNKVFRARLIHRDHPESPLSPPSTTTSLERFTAAMERSIQRRDLIARQLATSGSTGFQSQVIATSGEYLLKFSLGTPPQNFTAILDTGSDLVWVQCSPCISCFNQTEPLFNPNKSSSYSLSSCKDPLCSQVSDKSCDPNCHYNYTYASGTASAGHLSRDVLTLTDSTGISTAISDFAFGCGNENKISFLYQGVDGVVGLGQGKLSLGSQLSSQYRDVFSYCLPPFSLSNNTGISTELTFGRSIAAATNLTYTGILQFSSSSYYVPMIGVSINGADLGLSRAMFKLSSSGKRGVIFDSSTTLTTLPTSAYNSIKKKMTSLITYPKAESPHPDSFDLCYNISGVANFTFPTMDFQFTGTDSTTTVYYPLSGSNLFILVDTGNPYVRCLAMSGSDTVSIIGNIQQTNHYIEYDVVHHKIGWAETKC